MEASTSRLRGVQHPLAEKLMEKMRSYGNDPVSIWTVINQLADGHAPENRDKLRFLRLRYWGAFRELRRVGLLFRHGSMIAQRQFAPVPKRKALKISPLIRAEPSKNCGSKVKMPEISPSQPSVPARPFLTQQSATEPVKEQQAIVPETEKTKSVPRAPSDAEITMAGRALRLLPRRRKIMIGELRGQRIRRLAPVMAPDGQVFPAYFIRGSYVYVVAPDSPEYAGKFFERFKLENVKLHRSTEAALLGSLKRGKKEKPSAAKQRRFR